jgi:hypothetical protein
MRSTTGEAVRIPATSILALVFGPLHKHTAEIHRQHSNHKWYANEVIVYKSNSMCRICLVGISWIYPPAGYFCVYPELMSQSRNRLGNNCG